MDMLFRLLVYFLICVHSRLFVNAFETASFYGGSYIIIPLQDAKSTTEIQFRFRTKQPDALLFLAAGKTDYCFIKLQSGKLKVHINLGAGESELSSPKGLRLDDLTWHLVTLNRKDASVNVTIDKIHSVRETLPGNYFELNIHEGLFLGGSGYSLDLFLGHFDWLRGCLSAVFYNGIDVLKRARNRTFQTDVHGVTWSCASEFDASFSNDMSFMEDGAFMSMPNPVSRTGVRWQFEVKTNTEDCVLFYNSKLVQGGRNDFVGLEIANRKLRLVMDTGGGVTEVWNDASVVDGEWHLVTVQINTVTLEIVVDGKFTTTTHVTIKTGNKYLDLSDIVYIGGLELNKRASALAVGMKSADKSFKGCLRSMEADGKLLGFPNAKVTQGVLPNCVWSYQCSANPCISEATCTQYGVDAFHCECDKPQCLASDSVSKLKLFAKSSLPIAFEILSLNPVQVMEGENILITTDNINVILDYAKYGIRDSGVAFYVTQAPRHGSINIGSNDLASIDSNTIFSLLDLSNDKVHYIHDGSENYNDSFILDLEFTTSVGFALPAYLQGRNSFTVHVDIAPVNDPPFLFIAPVKVLRLAEGTRKVITNDLLNASDSDNSNSELLYSVLNQPSNSNGYIARLEAPNITITSFTQEDIDLGKIIFVHNGNSGEDKIALQVSDGVLSSALSFLRLSVFVLELHLVNNTGITLAQKSSALITHHSLAFKTNAEDPLLQIKYNITEFPKYGFVQCLTRTKNNQESWQAVTSWFTDQDILRETVRYVHTEETSSAFDVFKFKVSAESLVLPSRSLVLSTTYEFRATFVQLKLQVVANETIILSETRTAIIRESNLYVVTKPLKTNASGIVFTLLQAPKVSDLMLGDRIVRKNGTWTQKHIVDGKLSFRLHKQTFSDVNDYIIFSVSAAQCEIIENLVLNFKYQATEEQKNSVRLVFKPVQVSEGGQQPLLLENLNLVKENISLILYKILDGPSHGWLDMFDSDHTAVDKHNVTQFTNVDLAKQRVTYIHDDSESLHDIIHLVAYGQHGEDFQFVTKLKFEILLKNDNPPYCIVNNGLNVVVGGDKILTRRDLLYGDADIDAKPESITYLNRAIPNGAFMLADSPHRVLIEFSQNDINNGRVMFRHNGSSSANITMWVSDGSDFSVLIFNIIASAPFVKVSNNSKLLMRQGSQLVITANNLYSTTNINVLPQSIRYKVTKPPEVGQLELIGKNGHVLAFSQDDIDKGLLLYNHTGDLNSVKDKFLFQVTVKDKTVENEFHIRLFPAVYWEPLVLVNNETKHVDEASDVLITRDDLLVQQAHVPPSDIMYYVVEQPKYGYLEVEVGGRYSEVDFYYLFHPNSTGEDNAITFFNQTTVDDDRLHYIQVILNQTYDRVVLDATNGIIWYRNIVINFVIIPEQMYINASELHVEEGEFTRLTPTLFSVYSPYYADKISEFKVRKFPQHGWLQFIGLASKSANVSRWTISQLYNKQIQYIHDGSETVNDSMTVVAYAGDKESVPAVVNIIISPVNDEMPTVVNNTGASVWRGGMCNINSSNLAAVDRDTPAANITYHIKSTEAGYLAYFSNLNATVDKFTQIDVDAGKIAFVHSGAEIDGEFEAVVHDGKHTTDTIVFHVKTQLPVLTLMKHDFQIFPMLRKAITPMHLLTWCSDTNKNIFYVVKSPPKYGILTTADSEALISISNFSQADVNASRIWYQHTAHIVDADTSHDSFRFDAIATYATPITNEVFNIKIAVSSGGLDSMLVVETYEVEEGGVVKLYVNTTNLTNFLSSDTIGFRSPSLKAIITEPPAHGLLCAPRDVCSLTRLTNEQMNGGIVYKHDHSDSRHDNLTLTLYLESDNITLCNVTMHIIVNPINDQPFKLVQDSPNLSVVQGEKFVLSEEQLLTTDRDSYPEEIVYDVIKEPSVGSLYANGVRQAGSFTQADINAGLVVYEHSGPVQSTSFHFRVSDGRFTPTYKVFNIFVHAAKLSVSVLRPILLPQGSNSTTVPASIFSIQTNLRATEVTYIVTTAPRYGFILVNNTRNNTFTQNDLRAKRVVYVQSDMTVSGDGFEVEATLSSTDSRSRNLWLNITVEPLLRIGFFNPTAATRNCINEEVLNADLLFKKTSSNPVFDVIKKPKYGKLQKIIRRDRKSDGKLTRESRTVKQEDIDKFTMDEINSKVIYYIVAKKVNVSVEDSFTFTLTAASVQPAVGELKFYVNAESTTARTTASSSRPRTTTSSSKSKTATKMETPPSENGDVRIASPNMTRDTNEFFVGVIIALMLVSAFIVFVCRCRSKKRAEEDMKMHPPLPLPRPPDDLLPSSPYPKRNMLHSTPQCKVIPLGSDSLTSSEHDFNLRYPYGVPDEDWSSCDTAGYSTRNNNPMLRKNQYWV